MNTNIDASSQVSTVLTAARSQIGVPYRWGWATPGKGFDCSGLTMWAWGQAGVSLPHFTGFQVTKGTAVTKDQLQPGDLVFPDPGHVQIYSGNGNVIEAPRSGLNVREVPMWGFWKARRLVDSPVSSVNDFSIPGVGKVADAAASALIPGLPSFSNLFADSRHFMLRVIEVGLGIALILAGAVEIGMPAAKKVANSPVGKIAMGAIK